MFSLEESLRGLEKENLGLAQSFRYFSKGSVRDEEEGIVEQLEEEGFKLAYMSDPSQFCEGLKSSGGPESRIMKYKKGTTTLAFVYQGGIIIAVDSRASMGNFVSTEEVRKVLEINEFLLGTMAGGAADCQYWNAYLANECKIYELKQGEKVSVATASRMLTNIIYHYRGYGLGMGIMLAGSDKTGNHLYFLNDDGSRIKGNLFSIGSGSLYAYGVLDSYYRHDLTNDEAIELGVRAIYHATNKDSGSGGVVRVYRVHDGGWTKVHEGIDVNKLHYKYAHEKGLRGDGDETKGKIY